MDGSALPVRKRDRLGLGRFSRRSKSRGSDPARESSPALQSRPAPGYDLPPSSSGVLVGISGVNLLPDGPVVSNAVSAPNQLPDSGAESIKTVRQRVLDVTLQKLDAKDKETLGTDVLLGQDVSSVLGKARAACEEKQKICEQKRWRFPIGDRVINLKSQADNVIEWLDRFKAAGDIAVNADPIHAGLAWAGFRLVLEAATSERNQMAALLLGMETVAYQLSRLEAYLKYLCNLQQLESCKQLEESMIDFYTAILQFLASAARKLGKRTHARAFESFWKTDEISGFEEKCNKLALHVERDAQQCSRENTESKMKSLQYAIEHLGKMRNRNREIQQIWDKMDVNERSEALQWISPIPYETDHAAASWGRTKGTATWIFDRTEYKEWQTTPRSMIFWLNGIAGAGKTKLASSVVERIQSSIADDFSLGSLAYFYCDRTNDSHRDARNVLLSYIRQLALSPTEFLIRDPVISTYREKKKLGFPSGKLSYEEAEALLGQLIETNANTTLVLDALDECPVEQRRKLFQTFGSCIHNMPQLKIFVSSRRDVDITTRLQNEHNVGIIEIEATDNHDDIAKFVSTTIEANQKERQEEGSPLLSAELQDRIVNTLLRKSQGMFQWAFLHIQDLLSHKFEAEIQKRLEQLPATLVDTYRRILHEISVQDETTSAIAMRALQWITSSVEPLRPEILVAAVCQDPETDSMQPVIPGLTIDLVLSACKNLVVLVPKSYSMLEYDDAFIEEYEEHEYKTCQLSHLSVREYFEAHHNEMVSSSNSLVAEVCMLILNHWPSHRSLLQKEAVWPQGLGAFCEHFGLHAPLQVRLVNNGAQSERLKTSLRRFLISGNTTSQCFREWRDSYGLASGLTFVLALENFFRLRTNISGCDTPIFSACLFAQTDLLVEMLDMDSGKLEAPNGFGETPLLFAISLHLPEVVKTLCVRGANVGARRKNGKTIALGVAVERFCEEGDLTIVRTLLDHGADVNTETYWIGCGDTLQLALHCAKENCSFELINLLLKHGADVSSQATGLWGSSLAVAAASRCPPEVLQLLIDRGADVNAALESDYFGSVLEAACACSPDSVKLLIDNGAEVNCFSERGKFGSALVAAVSCNKLDAVRLLLDHGANVNAKVGGEHGSALAVAVHQGRSEVAQLLLDRGADVNLQLDGRFGNALLAAIRFTASSLFRDIPRNKVQCIKLLLAQNANVNARTNGHYGSILVAAISDPVPKEEYIHEITKLLIGHGANVNEHLNGYYSTALEAAIDMRKFSVVQLLLDNGAHADKELEERADWIEWQKQNSI